MASALTVTTSPLPLALIVVLLVPVITLIELPLLSVVLIVSGEVNTGRVVMVRLSMP